MLPGPQTARARLRALALAAVAAGVLGVPAAAAAAPVAVEHVGTTMTETTGNGDGLVAPGESFAITERIRNADPLVPTLTGISASVSEGENDITMVQTTSGYPDIAFGASADNSRPFTGSVSPAAECGKRYQFAVNVNATQGTAHVPFFATTGAPGPFAPHDSTDVPKLVPDLATAQSTLGVASAGRVKDLRVRLGELVHTATGDVKIELVAPDGASVVLVDGEDPSGNDFRNTVFSDSAAQPIAGAQAPFTGTYRPEQPLSDLAGRQTQGTWTLRVTDQLGSDQGQLNAWGLDVSTALCDGSPIASFTAQPNPALPGQAVALDASASTDPNGTVASYEWDLDNDGAFDDGIGRTLSTAFAVRGRYPVTLRVTDDTGKTGTATVEVAVTTPPKASFTVSPTSPLTGEQVELNASGSTDPDGDPIARYEWDLDGDETFERDQGTTALLTTQFATIGTRTVRLRVTDAQGVTDVSAVEVIVRNRPPTAAFSGPAPAIVGTAGSFDASTSSDSDGSVARYEWDFDGDGVYERDAGASATAQHTFSSPGVKTVGLRVTDDHGGVATTTASVNVTNRPVAAFTATPNPVSLQRPVVFDAAGSSDADGTIVRHEWDLDGNGSFETDTDATASASRAYATAGTYAVQLRVTDDDGARATVAVSVVAANRPPVAAIAVSPNPAVAGEPVLLDARAAHDPDGTIVRYDWDLDGNGSFEATTGATPTRSHAYPNSGGFTVGVRVTDNHGGVRTAAAALTVNPPPSTSTAPGTTDGGAGSPTAGTEPGGGTTSGPARFQAALSGRPLQKLSRVVSRGLVVGCRTDRAARCVLRAELQAADARRLGLRTSRRRPVVVGRVSVSMRAGGARGARLRLSAKGRRALRRARGAKRSVRVSVRGTAASRDGRRVKLVRTFLLRR